MLDTTQEYKNIKRFATLTQLIEDAEAFMFSKNYPGFEGDALFYAEDVSCFFCLRAVAIVDYGEIPEEFRKKYLPTGVAGYYHNILFPVNDFGDYTLEDSDDADRIELKAVPVDIDATDHGPCCFLPFSDASDSEGDSTLVDEIRQPKSLSLILGGKKERAQFYDKLYVGFWTGLPENYQKTGRYPYTSNVSLYDGWHYRLSPEGCSLRLNHGFRYGSEDFMNVDFNKIYKISFISDTIPNIAAVFNIRGKRYLCRKLSADFSDSGLSRIIKGEFYRISQPTDTPQSS